MNRIGRRKAHKGCFCARSEAEERQKVFRAATLKRCRCARRQRGASRNAVGAVKKFMWSYVLKRVLLMIPTLFGILLITFVVTQFVPGGPVEQMVAQLQGRESGAGEGPAASAGTGYRGRQGVDAKRVEEIRKLYGFDKPAHERFCADARAVRALRPGQELLPQQGRGRSSSSRSCRYRSVWACGRSCSSISSRCRSASRRPCARALDSTRSRRSSCCSAMRFRAS